MLRSIALAIAGEPAAEKIKKILPLEPDDLVLTCIRMRGVLFRKFNVERFTG